MDLLLCFPTGLKGALLYRAMHAYALQPHRCCGDGQACGVYGMDVCCGHRNVAFDGMNRCVRQHLRQETSEHILPVLDQHQVGMHGSVLSDSAFQGTKLS